MIKKSIIFALVLVFAIVPVVHGDAGGAPRPVDGKIIDIAVRAMSSEISIGEEATLEITITNLTQYRVSPVRMYLGFMWFKIDYDEYMLNIDTDDLELGAYESITFEVTDNVSEYLSWYRVGDEYYIDVEAEINFFVDEADNPNYDYNYQFSEDIITLKINNLYDGSDLVEIEWLDDRDTMYYCEALVDDYYDDGGEELESKSQIYYEMSIKNNTDTEILDIAPHSEEVIHDCFYDFTSKDEVDDTYIHRFSPVFYADGKYYCIEETRTYTTEFIVEPDVDIQIEAAESEDNSSEYKYSINIKNTGTEPIKSFMVKAEKQYVECGDIKEGETINIEYTCLKDDEMRYFSYGYLLDGMYICWYKYVDTKTSDTDEITISISDRLSMNVSDYEYKKRIEEAEATPTPKPITETAPEATTIPTLAPTAEPTPDISITAGAASQSEITVTKRQNPMLWLMMIVVILAAIATMLIVKIIRMKGSSDD